MNDEDLKQIAKVVKWMADTGNGTDFCLQEGCLPVPVHFYQPIPDLNDLRRRKVWDRISPLRGINMNVESQIGLLKEMSALFGHECKWPLDPTTNPKEFYLRNNSFGFQCASLLHYMIRYFTPKKILEIGSGFSSRIIAQALALNSDTSCNHTIIDPYPNEVIKSLPATVNVNKVEEVPETFFEQLESGDILFIDSSHCVRIGGDVNYLFLDILPVLKKGVIIHIHDIPMPKEYGEAYFTNPSFRMFWTESYLLQAFLMFNDSFSVLASAGYINCHHRDLLPEIFINDPLGGTSGSIWIRRVK